VWTAVFDNETISSGSTVTNPGMIHLFDKFTSHSFEYAITGDGSVSIEVLTSVSGKFWVSNGTKLSGATKTSGPDSNGRDIIDLLLKPGEFIQFKVTVSSADVVLTLWFAQK